MGLIVVVTGSRDWVDRNRVVAVLDELEPDMVVEGGAKGADRIARDWCDLRGVTCVEVPALWGSLGKKAGQVRNKSMLNIARQLASVNKDDLLVVAFPLPQSKGTTMMISLARQKGLEVHVVDLDGTVTVHEGRN
jgi:hypothetical protein